MLVPLYGFLKGDTIGLVVLVHDHQKVRDIATSLAQAACMRVAPHPSLNVYHRGQALDPDLTVSEAGLEALERVDVVPEEI